jgi:multidrug efflux pump
VNISAPFISRPVATTLLAAALGISGAIALPFLRIAPLPLVEFPSLTINAVLPGANPETMASAVAAPLERQLGHIAGVNEMTSASALGTTTITMQFDLNRNIDAAARDVQAAINAARSQLPQNLPQRPSWRKANPADVPFMFLALTSDTMGPRQIYDFASTVLQQKFSQIKGVGQVTLTGGSQPAVRIDVNPTQLNHFGLGLEDVRSFLAGANANRPKGDFTNAARTWSINTTDQLMKANEYAPLVVAYKNGGAVKLSDVASVTDSIEDIRATGFANGKPAIIMLIYRQPGENIVEVFDRVKAALPEAQAQSPPSLHMAILLDGTGDIRASVRDIEITLCISIALVILVVFLFLRDLRTTSIPSVAVPLSLAGTFGVLYVLDYSLDNLSLMAMTVATGFVVDDAIVVIENITRYIEEGMSPPRAALRGAREIGPTVVSISLSLIAVFIPILLMQGFVGRLFREFAITLSTAVVISLGISLTLTPMMCAHLLSERSDKRHNLFYRIGEAVFQFILRIYAHCLRVVLRHQPVTLVVTLSTIGLSVYLYIVIPKGFFPQQDTGRMSGQIQADQSTSFTAMRQRIIQASDILRADPAVENVMAFMGGRGGALNSATMFMTLKPVAVRKMSADRVIAELRPKLGRIPGAGVFLQAVQPVRIGTRIVGAQYQYTMQSDNVAELNRWAPLIFQQLRAMPQLADVNIDQQNKGLQTSLAIDRNTAARLGISTKLIDDTLYDAFGQRQVSTLYTPLAQYHVVMEADPRFWQNPESLQYIYVKGTNGQQTPLSAIAHYESTTAPLTINHQGLFPSATISFNLPGGTALGAAVSEIEQAERAMGMPPGIHGSFAGTAQAYQESLANEPILIAAALLSVYLVLGMLYESLIHPLTILSTLPSAGVGALLALMATKNELNVISLIGIILLIGIVKKNAIMLIDFAIRAERDHAKTPEDAIFEACLLRFRPITMTTMAAMFGGLPMALGTGPGAELRHPLGIAIVGGLIFSQALTLFTTPVIYLYLDRWRIGLEALRRPQARNANIA